MKGGPTTPKIKQYFKACESVGYKPTSVRMCFDGDVILYFGEESGPDALVKDEWEIAIAET